MDSTEIQEDDPENAGAVVEPFPGESADDETSMVEDEPTRKRKYKVVAHDDGLSGSYWKSPAVGENTRPRRSNAGSLMKSALMEIDSKKKKVTPVASTSKPPSSLKSLNSSKDEAETPSTSTTSTPRKPFKSEPPQFYIQPYEKPVTRTRGRPRKEGRESKEAEEAKIVKVETNSSDEKNTQEVKPAKSVPRTYGRKAAEPKASKPAMIRTYGRRRPKNEITVDTEEPVDGTTSTADRVSPSMALIAALSIPDEILPTSHEIFLDKLREDQEKSPTPPDLLNLDEVVASYKSTSKVKAEMINSPSESDTESNSGSASSQSDQICSVSALKLDTARTGWVEDDNVTVVKLENNQLLINNNLIDIDYTNYVKEIDVEVPYDYDVIFEPEAKLTPEEETKDPPASIIEQNVAPSSALVQLEESVTEVCKLEACKKGCICDSLKLGSPLRDHCGRTKCLLECVCLFKDQLLINGDEKNIRSRLRPRVTLLNWKNITKNGGSELIDSGTEHGTGKKKSGKGKKKRSELGEGSSKRFKAGGVEDRNAPVLSKSSKLAPVPYSRPGPKSSKLKAHASYLKMDESEKTMPVLQRISSNTSRLKKPTMISSRFPSNHPILRRIYSCQPCNVNLIKMPSNWSDWKTVETLCSGGRTTARKSLVTKPMPMSYQTASSNFRVAAQTDLSFVIVRPNGTILALLYWEAHTKTSPRSAQRMSPVKTETSYPWLYLPLPSAGKVWLFYEIPKYPDNAATIWLPELGVFLPTDKLKLMMAETVLTKKTKQIYFQSNDGERLTEEGLLGYVYLVPDLPSLIVYGPIPKTCLRVPSRKLTASTLRKFEECETSKHLRIKLDAAGTDVDEVTENQSSAEKDPIEYVDDIDREDDLVDEAVWEDVYKDYMIPMSGNMGSDESDSDEMEYEDYWEEYVEVDEEGLNNCKGNENDDMSYLQPCHAAN